MSEENNQQASGEQNTVTNNDTQVETNETPKDVPYARLQEVNNQKKAFQSENETLKQQLEAIKQKDAKAREEQLKQNNQHEVLLKEKDAIIETQAKEVEQWNTYKTTKRESLMDRLSESDREFGEGIPLDKHEKFVESKAQSSNAVKTDASRPANQSAGEFGGYESAMEFMQKDPEGYSKWKSKDVGDKFGNIFTPNN